MTKFVEITGLIKCQTLKFLQTLKTLSLKARKCVARDHCWHSLNDKTDLKHPPFSDAKVACLHEGTLKHLEIWE